MEDSGHAEMERRMDEIRLKQMLGGDLTNQELMCLQIEGQRLRLRELSEPGAAQRSRLALSRSA